MTRLRFWLEALDEAVWLGLVLAFGLLVAMLAGCKPPPSPLMPTCGTTTGSACAVDWALFPLHVSAEPSAYDGALHQAVQDWNRAVDKPVFAFCADGEASEVDVFYVGEPSRAAGWYVPGAGRASVYVNNPGDVLQARWVIEHELGHALGLRHSEWQTSVMRRDLDVGLMSDWDKLPMLVIEGSTAEALRRRYFGGG